MIKTTNFSLAIAAIFIWIGFIGAISFMEAWIKFQAPGITLALGLGIGRLVFSALNKMEWILLILILISFIFGINKPNEKFYFLISIPFLILFAQTFFLLPAVNQRAETIISGGNLAPSSLHIIYVVLECLKFSTLLFSGYHLLKNNNHERIGVN